MNVKKLLNQVRGLLPSALPQGMAEFDAWAESIADTYNLPTKELDSIKYALATMIMHLGPTTAYKSKVYFALSIRAGAAKQIAGACFYEIKRKQQEAAELAKKQAEVTAQLTVTSDVQTTQQLSTH